MASGGDDDMLSQFVKPDFDSKDFVHGVVRRNSVSDDLAHLRQGIAVLESQLREQVVSHHGRLIEQVSHAKDLEVLVDTVTSGVSRLQASLGSVKAKIREPYEIVASKTAQLERLQSAGEVLRAVIRIRDISTKLAAHVKAAETKSDNSAMKDLAQAAACCSEIRACMGRCDLEGVEEVEKRKKGLAECHVMIRSKSQKVLLEAVLMRQQQDMANSLQVFFSLEALPGAVEAVLVELIRLARSAAASAVDTSTLPLDSEEPKGWTSKQRGPTNANAAAAWKTALWGRLEMLIETIAAKCAQVWQLYRVLSKRRDVSTHTLFAEAFNPAFKGENDTALYTSFWARLLQGVVDQLVQGGEKNTFVKGMLTAEYPRVRQLLLNHYHNARSTSDAGIAGALGELERQSLLAALQPLAAQHLSRATSRVNDAIGQLFNPKAAGAPSGVPPLAGDVGALQKTMNNIVLGTRIDAQLAREVAESMAGAIQLFVNKCRENTNTDIDPKLASGALSMSQTRNLSIYSAAIAVEETLVTLSAQLASASASEAAEVYAALAQQAGQRAREAVRPLIESLQAGLLESMANMHLTDIRPQMPADMPDDMDPTGAEQCSNYMQECLQVLTLLTLKLLPRLAASLHLNTMLEVLAVKALGMLVRHVTLLRTLDETAKMQVMLPSSEACSNVFSFLCIRTYAYLYIRLCLCHTHTHKLTHTRTYTHTYTCTHA